MPHYALARDLMVDVQLAARGIRDRRVLTAMRTVPREEFVEAGFYELAYADSALPIGDAQTISQPFIVARMIEAAGIGPTDHVLEVGAGSGYAAAVMSRIAEHVHAVERHPRLADAARRRLTKLGYDNVLLHVGDGTLGWPGAAPFDAIVVAAGGPAVPQALQQQLAIGGRLVIPIGPKGSDQILLKVKRCNASEFSELALGTVIFVPLIGVQGWADADAAGQYTQSSW